ncbi:MAG: hypothetical protein WBA52_10240 [Dolichospermum sp.]
MSNKENFDFEYWGVKIATVLAESKLSPTDYINDMGENPNNLQLCVLCKIIIELQSKNVVVLNNLLVEIEKSYPSLSKEGSQDGWDLTYKNYVQKINDENITKMSELFDIFLNQAQSFGN